MMLVLLLLLLLLHHEISQQEIDLGQELDLELCSFSIGYSLNIHWIMWANKKRDTLPLHNLEFRLVQ